MSKFSFTRHALERVRERTKMEPECVLFFLENGVFYEAHRGNGISYLVIWSAKENRPYLAIASKGVIISFYYTYEMHARKDGCIVLPVHIREAKKAWGRYSFSLNNQTRYHLKVFWEEFTPSGKKKEYFKRLGSFPRSEFDLFEGTLLEFVAQKPEFVEVLSGINIPRGSEAFLILRKPKTVEPVIKLSLTD